MFEINKKQWELMTYYTRLFLMLLVFCGGLSLLILIAFIVGNYAY